MPSQTAQLGSIHIDHPLGYDGVIELDKRENLNFSPYYPALIQLHEEIPAEEVPLHWHKGAEFVYVRHGCVRLLIDGRVATVGQGQICLVSPNAHHAIYPMPSDGRQSVLSVTFDDRHLARLAPGLHDRCLQQCVPIGTDTAYPDDEMLAMCEELIAVLDDTGSELRLIRANRLIYALLERMYTVYIAENCDLCDSAANQNADSRIKPMIDFMERNYAAGITVADVACEFGYDRAYFSRLFKKYAGIGPERYLVELRLQSSVDALMHSVVPCNQIAEEQGFASGRAFSRAFEKRYGMTPSVFRRMHRERRIEQLDKA